MSRFIRRATVCHRTGLAKTSIYDMVKRGEFPAPVRLSDSGTSVAWIEEEVEAWMESRIDARRTSESMAAA